jgi:O-antigen/teichoic acid export membrane protein
MNRVIENTSALLVANLIGRILSLGLTLLLASVFSDTEGQEVLGQYFLAMFITNMIASIAELGMQAPLIREMTLHLQQARHFVGNALIIRILLSIVAFVVMLGTSYLLEYPPMVFRMIILLGLAELINAVAQLFRCVFRAFEQMKYEAFTVLVERSLVVFGGGLLILLGVDLGDFCVMVLIASLMNLIVSVSIVRTRFTSLRFQFNLGLWRTLMSQALPFALGNIFNLVYFRIDAVMLSKLSPDGVAANAWYGLAYTIVNAFTILPGAFMGAMFPVMSRTLEEELDFAPMFTYAFRWMFIIGLPFAVGITILAPELSRILFPAYGPETIAPALRLLSWSGGLIFLTTVIITVFRAADKRLPFTLIMGATMLINIGLNYLLIPGITVPGTSIQIASHVAASVTMIISEAFLLTVGFIYISKNIAKLTQLGFIIKAVIISGLMGAGLIFLKSHYAIWLLIPIAIAFYFVGLVVSREIRWRRAKYDVPRNDTPPFRL